MKNDNTENDSENNELSEMMKQNLGTDVDKLGSRILQMKIKPPVCKEGN